MKILVLDNYDSFTYNLVYQMKRMDCEVKVLRNDKVSPKSIDGFDGLVLSPGPGIPSEAGNMPAIIEHLKGRLPMLGICLGHQAIAENMGAQLSNMAQVYHGIQSPIKVCVNNSELFKGLPQELVVGRYHSWQVSSENLPEQVRVTAVDLEGAIMAIECHSLRMYGLQFHPESILTPNGTAMVQNFIQICKRCT